MAERTFDDLLVQMAAISTAVNAFTSESVQQLAFQALLRSLNGDADEPTHAPRTRVRSRPPRKARKLAGSEGVPEEKPGKAAARKRSTKSPSLVKGLNFRPQGKTSFRDFAVAKAPRSNDERSAVAVYWLSHDAELTNLTVNHVYSGYKEARWKVPPDLATGMQITASTKGYLNTSDSNNIRLDVRGENLVEHDLPRATKARK